VFFYWYVNVGLVQPDDFASYIYIVCTGEAHLFGGIDVYASFGN